MQHITCASVPLGHDHTLQRKNNCIVLYPGWISNTPLYNLYLNLSIYGAIIVFGMDLFVSHVCVDEVKLLLSSVQLHRTKEVLLEKTMLSSPHTIALVFSTIMKNQNSHCLYYWGYDRAISFILLGLNFAQNFRNGGLKY